MWRLLSVVCGSRICFGTEFARPVKVLARLYRRTCFPKMHLDIATSDNFRYERRSSRVRRVRPTAAAELGLSGRRYHSSRDNCASFISLSLAPCGKHTGVRTSVRTQLRVKKRHRLAFDCRAQTVYTCARAQEERALPPRHSLARSRPGRADECLSDIQPGVLRHRAGSARRMLTFACRCTRLVRIAGQGLWASVSPPIHYGPTVRNLHR
jgi:hypothetical protein